MALRSKKGNNSPSAQTFRNQGNCKKCGRMANKLVNGMGACCASKHTERIMREHREKQMAVFNIMAEDFADPEFPMALLESLTDGALMISDWVDRYIEDNDEHPEAPNMRSVYPEILQNRALRHQTDLEIQLDRRRSPFALIASTADNFSYHVTMDTKDRYSLQHQLRPAQVYLGKIFALNGLHSQLDNCHFWTDNCPEPKNLRNRTFDLTCKLFEHWEQFLDDDNSTKLQDAVVDMFDDLGTDDYFNWMATSPASLAIINMAVDPENELYPFKKSIKYPSEDNFQDILRIMEDTSLEFSQTKTYYIAYAENRKEAIEYTKKNPDKFKKWLKSVY